PGTPGWLLQSSRTPKVLRPCSQARGVALPVLSASKPSRWVRAGQRGLLRGKSPPGDRAGEPPFHRLRVRFEPTARYLRALTPGTAVHRRRPRPRAAKRSALTFVRLL